MRLQAQSFFSSHQTRSQTKFSGAENWISERYYIGILQKQYLPNSLYNIFNIFKSGNDWILRRQRLLFLLPSFLWTLVLEYIIIMTQVPDNDEAERGTWEFSPPSKFFNHILVLYYIYYHSLWYWYNFSPPPLPENFPSFISGVSVV